MDRLARNLALALCSVCLGCPGRSRGEEAFQSPVLVTRDAVADRDMQLARQAAAEGRRSEAIARLEGFLVEHAGDPLVPVAHLELGYLYTQQGDWPLAEQHLDRVATEDTSMLEGLGFYRGILRSRQGRHREAVELLEPFLGRSVGRTSTSDGLNALATSAQATSAEIPLNYVPGLRALDALVEEQPKQRKAHGERAATWIGSAPEEPLNAALNRLPNQGAMWPLVMEQLIRMAFERGEMVRVRALASELQGVTGRIPQGLRDMVARASAIGAPDPRVIGVILPLTGRARAVGNGALQALMLGVDHLDPGSDMPTLHQLEGLQLVVRDDGGDPQRAAHAVEELTHVHRAIAIIGPVVGDAATAAGKRAEGLGIPILPLSAALPSPENGLQGFPADESRVFPFFHNASTEIRDLLRTEGLKEAGTFAVVHPDNEYGARWASALEVELGKPVQRVSYGSETTAFESVAQQVAALNTDVLFFADRWQKAVLIAPALRAAGIASVDRSRLGRAPTAPPSPLATPRSGAGADLEPVRSMQFVLPSVAFPGRILGSNARYFNGAIFSVPFHGELPADEAASMFVQVYEQRHGTPPDIFAAYAHDALTVLRRALERGGIRSRDELAARLRGIRVQTVGATGGFRPSGTPWAATRVYRLQGTEFIPSSVPNGPNR